MKALAIALLSVIALLGCKKSSTNPSGKTPINPSDTGWYDVKFHHDGKLIFSTVIRTMSDTDTAITYANSAINMAQTFDTTIRMPYGRKILFMVTAENDPMGRVFASTTIRSRVDSASLFYDGGVNNLDITLRDTVR